MDAHRKGDRLRRSTAGWALLLLLAGCTGNISGEGEGSGEGPNGPGAGNATGSGGSGGSAPGTGGTTSPGTGGSAAGGGMTGDNCTPAPPLSPGLVLLPDYQFVNAIRGLLGESAVDPQAPDAASKTFTQKGTVVSTSLVDTRIAWAKHAADSLRTRFFEVTACSEDDTDACAQAFIQSFGSRAFRRPLGAEEVTDLMGVYQVGRATDFVTGVTLAVQAILASPSFVYRTEFGERDASGRITLTPFEIATELSFLLTDAGPDPELYAAAESGALRDPAEIRRQVQRLLAIPAVQQNLTQTLLAAWGVGNVLGKAKDPTLFPEYGPLLQSSMFRETELFVNDALWGGASADALLTSNRTFVNAALADYYGVAYSGTGDADFVPVDLPADQRAGLLTQPSILTARAGTEESSVVFRGLFVHGALLCLRKVPAPPETLAEDIQELLDADMTERERAEVRAGQATCGGCHASFDPYGLALEHYDAIGRYRQVEDNGAPIDAVVDLTGIAGLSGTVNGAVEFAQALVQTSGLEACLARHVIAYGSGHETLDATSCEVQQTMGSLPSEAPSMAQIVEAAVLSPAFYERVEEVQP